MNKLYLTAVSLVLAAATSSAFAVVPYQGTALRGENVVVVDPFGGDSIGVTLSGFKQGNEALLVRGVKPSDTRNPLALKHAFRADNDGQLYVAVGNLRTFYRSDTDHDGILTPGEAARKGVGLGWVNCKGGLNVTRLGDPVRVESAKILYLE